jgi:hypothetical protein
MKAGTLVSCSAFYSFTLKMEAICWSETSVDTLRITGRYIPEDRTLYNYRCENLKSYTLFLCYYFYCRSVYFHYIGLYVYDTQSGVGVFVWDAVHVYPRIQPKTNVWTRPITCGSWIFKFSVRNESVYLCNLEYCNRGRYGGLGTHRRLEEQETRT